MQKQKNNSFKNKLTSFIGYYFPKKKEWTKSYENGDVILDVRDLCKRYGHNAPLTLNHLNFKVMKGEFHAFIGGNGAGKTTTIKSLVGAYKKFDGDVFINGINNRLPKSKNFLGYIPEVARFPVGMSTLSYLVSMCQMSGLKHNEAVKYSTQKIEELNMKKFIKKSPNTFSSGQKKKILMAQALVHDPQLLIMDEPAANLDPVSRLEFFNSLKKLQEQGKAIFISSHILSELDKYADSCTVLDGGKIVFTGKVSEESKHTYLVQVNSIDNFKKVMEQMKLKYFKPNFKNEFIIEFSSNDDEINILNNLKEENVINAFIKYTMTLEDIYSKYVLKNFYEVYN